MANRFAMTFSATAEDIDELGHVNNAVWVRWMERIAVAHWEHDALPDHVAAYAWVVTRHEIDYRSNIREGDMAHAETFIPEKPTGARFNRCTEFRDAAGKLLVASRTTWALLDRASGRLMRVPAEVAAPFLP
ncbi:thioesterase-like protein [Novosphingobium nitrogenifigens DSM 19370]|uniref:Thioesterase-like protein n=1 Tax=Novosphingobium nitrogenifigens DSM 19370 TaxID=983920 RepID=F1ZCM3_9SPHN|nr:acyl-CoA thioesterase [Novosphingobium nitrogenifigens]EGD57640.1 thioesterase-like protein [Novosphingobium nitrogenifigens DSM 19370]